MRIKKDIRKPCRVSFCEIEQEFNKLEQFVMESKQFEKAVIGLLAFVYVYIGVHIGLWIFGVIS